MSSSLMHQIFTHHGASRLSGFPASPGPGSGQSLLSTCGRLVAVGAGACRVDIYDLDQVGELESTLGTGSCKFKLLGSVDIVDAVDAGSPVSLHGLSFLHGGYLATTGANQHGDIGKHFTLVATTLVATNNARGDC